MYKLIFAFILAIFALGNIRAHAGCVPCGDGQMIEVSTANSYVETYDFFLDDPSLNINGHVTSPSVYENENDPTEDYYGEYEWGYSSALVPLNRLFTVGFEGGFEPLDQGLSVGRIEGGIYITIPACYNKVEVNGVILEHTGEEDSFVDYLDIRTEYTQQLFSYWYVLQNYNQDASYTLQIDIFGDHEEGFDNVVPYKPIEIKIISEKENRSSGSSEAGTGSGDLNSLPDTYAYFDLPLGMVSSDLYAGELSFLLYGLNDSSDPSLSTFNSGIIETSTDPIANVYRRSSGDLVDAITQVEGPEHLFVIKDGWWEGDSQNEEDGYDGQPLAKDSFEIIAYPNYTGSVYPYTPTGDAEYVWHFEKTGSSSNGDLGFKVTKTTLPGQAGELVEWDSFERITVDTLEDGSPLTTPLETGWRWISRSGDLRKDLFWKETTESGSETPLYEYIAFYDTRQPTSPELISKTKVRKEKFGSYGWLDTQRIEDPDDANRITSWTYDAGEIKSVEYPDGSWVYYVDDNTRYLPWKDVTLASAIANNGNNCKVVTTVGDVTTTSIAGQVVSMSDQVSSSDTWTYANATEYLVSSSSGSEYVSADGTVTTTVVENGYWDAATQSFTSSDTGVEAIQRTTKHGVVGSTDGVPGKTTWDRTVSVGGKRVLSQLILYNDTSTPVVKTTRYTESANTPSSGMRTETTEVYNEEETSNERIISKRIYDEDDRLVEYVDESGVSTTYAYDLYDRLASEVRAEIKTTYQYGPNDRIENTIVEPVSGGGDTLTTSTTYHPTGEVYQQTDVNGLTAKYEYSNGGRTMTVTRPDGSTEITDYYLDGQIKSITGTGVVHRFYDYSVDQTTGFRITRESIGSATSDRWNEREVDWAGRLVEERRPAYSGANHVTSYSYEDGDSTNTTTYQLAKVERTGGSPTIYEYNELGQRTRQGRDLDSDSDFDESSGEPITETTRDFVEISGEWYERSTTKRWLTDNDATPTTMSVVKRQLTGLSATTMSSVVYTDALGQDTIVTTTVDRGNQTVTETTDLPNTTRDAVRITENGRLKSSTDPRIPTGENATTAYAYDGLGRLITITDPKGEITTQTYHSETQLLKTIEPPIGGYTEFEYYGQDELGAGQVKTRSLKTADSAGTINQIEYAYDAHGRVVSEGGSGTYPVAYGYDPTYGERTTLTTYRDGVTPDVSTWTFQEETGLMTRKEYADGNRTVYTYHDSGQLHTRTWERGVTTTYTYDNLGQLDETDYSDGTTDIYWTFNRAGRLVGVKDAAGEHTLSYEPDGQLAQHSVVADGVNDILDGFALVNDYNNYGQRTDLDVSLDSTGLSAQDLAYNTDTSRLNTVSFDHGGSTHTATYGYKPNTNLVQSVVQDNGSANILAVQKSYDELDQVTELAYGVPHEHLGIGYVYNDAGQRQFAVKPNGDYWHYQYDAMGQVTGATKHLADKTAIPGYGFDYAYDSIGNRLSVGRDGDSDRLQEYYSGANATGDTDANSVNQYGSRSVPRKLGVLGSVNENASVSVNGTSATQTGEYFQALLDYSGETSPNDVRYEDITVTGTYAGQGAGGVDAIAEAQTNAYLPPNPENFTYDDDGNLTGDGRWAYIWNGENRLIKMVTKQGAVNAGVPKQKLEFVYDYQGRRVQKIVSDWDSQISDWEANPEILRFFYDDWNLIVEVDSNDVEVREHVWGLDLAHDFRAMGGVGALLATADASGTYYAAYEGNGNITTMVNSLTAAPVAEYGYGPFGQPLRKSGALADDLPFGFSTKYQDTETELAYYGYRYYNAELGRWPSRDPIGDHGGLNLYAFVSNSGVNQVDYLGLFMGPGFFWMGQNKGAGNATEFGFGPTHRNSHKLPICYLRDAESVADEIYKKLADFSLFNNTNFDQTAYFNPENNTVRFVPPDVENFANTMIGYDKVTVKITYDDEARFVYAQTTGTHFLHGNRTWGVLVNEDGINGEVFTHAREQFASPHFLVGSTILDYLIDGGFNSQVDPLWSTYLTNVVDYFEKRGDIVRTGEVVFRQW